MLSTGQEGRREVVAGVPPDYFSATGQLWGNPHYAWDKMCIGFSWWKERIRTVHSIRPVRIDHFRGLEAYWEIPATAETAVNGCWQQTPGHELLKALQEEFGRLPLVAEDLGIITPEVEALRDSHGLPGMKVLHFALAAGPTIPTYRTITSSMRWPMLEPTITTPPWAGFANWTSQLGASVRLPGRRPGADAGSVGADGLRFRGAAGGDTDAGLAGAGQRGSHEPAGRAGWQLDLAVPLGADRTAHDRPLPTSAALVRAHLNAYRSRFEVGLQGCIDPAQALDAEQSQPRQARTQLQIPAHGPKLERD